MKDKLKIAIYAGEIPSTTFIERLIVGLAQNGQQILLLGRQKEKVMYDSAAVKVLSYSDTKWNKFIYLAKYSLLLFCFRKSELKRLNQHIYKNTPNHLVAKRLYYPVLWHKPDVFHLQWTKGTDDWTWIGEFGMKLVVSLRGAQINYSPLTEKGLDSIYKQHFPKVDGFHAVSKAIGREAEKYGASPDKIQVVYSGLKKVEVRDKKIDANIFTIISVGRTHWKKGYNYALEACKLLKDSGFVFQYQIIGAKDSEELTYLATSFNLQNEVVLLGGKTFVEVQRIMQNANVLLLPSVEEGIANVVLEAMQLGTLVVSTDCGGMDEVIENGQNGIIVPVRDPQKMAEALLKIAQLPTEAKQRMIERAKITINDQHTKERMISDMIALYKNVLDR